MALRSFFVSDAALTVLLFLVALLLRAYNLAASPLWLDEIYGYQLGHLGLGAIIANSRHDPHPPLYYLIQWVTAGSGMFRHELAWRWFPCLSGALSVALLYLLLRQRSSQIVAGATALILATLPLHIHYSQEARSFAFLVLMAVVSTLLMRRVETAAADWRSWLAWAAALLIGLYSGYSFAMVAGCQVLYMLIGRPWWRVTLLVGLGMLLAVLPLLFWMAGSLTSAAAVHAEQAWIGLALFEALLGGDPVRYGHTWAHQLISWILIGLALIGMIWGLRTDRRTVYDVVQIVLPLLSFFLILVMMLGIRLPLTEAKQFLVLLPALLILVALGMQAMLRILADQRSPFGKPAASLVLLVLALLVYSAGLYNSRRHWDGQRSPEAAAVLAVRAAYQTGDAVVSLHYSTNAALSFYMHDIEPYTQPFLVDDQVFFRHSTLVLIGQAPPDTAQTSLAQLYSHQRIWVLGLQGRDDAAIQNLAQPCASSWQAAFPPFQALLLEHCNPPDS